MPEICKVDKSVEIVDFDPQEWKELFPGVFYNRMKKDMFCFRCPAKVEPVVEPKVEKKQDK